MGQPSLQASVFKLAMAREQAGFAVEQMIQMLDAGVTGWLRVIGSRLAPFPGAPSFSRRIT